MTLVSKIKPRYSEKISKNITLEIYGGWNEIGGNCVKIIDRGLDRTIVFDQGIRFSVYSRYYSLLIQPRGLFELRELGIVPDPRIFSGVDSVYISHMHLDHLGVLSNIDKRDVEVYIPSLEFHEKIKRGEWTYSEWKQLLMPARPFVKILRSDEAREPVLALEVSHSSFPAYSYIYFGSDTTILYSGDLRSLQSSIVVSSNPLQAFLEMNSDLKVDYLILEGTNIGRTHTPISEQEFRNILSKYIEGFKSPVFINVDERDLECIKILLSVIGEKRKVWIVDKRLAIALDAYIKEFPILQNYFENVVVLDELFADVKGIPSFWSNKLVSLEDLEENIEGVFLLGRNIVETIKSLRSWGLSTEGSPILLLESEPTSEEFIIEARKVESWLNIFKMVPIRVRLSGHYYPHEFKEILKIVKPRKLIPIHTKAPRAMITLFEKYRQ